MRLYTSKVVAEYLDLSERRVRQLRDEGIIQEVRPGLYELRPTIARYINYLRGKTGAVNYTAEKALLTKAKREVEEIDLAIKRGDAHTSADVRLALTTMLLNFKTRLAAIPAKLSPELAKLKDTAQVFDTLKAAVDEALEELAEYEQAFKRP